MPSASSAGRMAEPRPPARVALDSSDLARGCLIGIARRATTKGYLTLAAANLRRPVIRRCPRFYRPFSVWTHVSIDVIQHWILEGLREACPSLIQHPSAQPGRPT